MIQERNRQETIKIILYNKHLYQTMVGVQSSTPGECCLCNRNCSQLSTLSTWKDTSSKVIAESLGISENSAVCRECRQDIKRLMHNPTLVPRWNKHTKKRCCVTGCSAECFCETEVMSADELSSTLGIEMSRVCYACYKAHLQLIHEKPTLAMIQTY